MVNDIYRKYAVLCGLIFGLADFIDTFVDLYLFSGNKKFLRMVDRPFTGLKQLYLIKPPKELATPGEGLLKASCDYATGVAGVMRTIHRYATKDKADFMLDEIDLGGKK